MTIYTETYFHEVDGYFHPAGWNDYSREYSSNVADPDCQGEVFKTRHYKFWQAYKDRLNGKKILEVGSALGFFTEDMREFGLDVSGMDICEWAVNQSAGNCVVGDVRADLENIAEGAYDVIIGLRLLPCLSDNELVGFRQQVERISSDSIFVVDDLAFYEQHGITGADEYYNVKTLEEWQALFPNSTIESIADQKWWGV